MEEGERLRETERETERGCQRVRKRLKERDRETEISVVIERCYVEVGVVWLCSLPLPGLSCQSQRLLNFYLPPHSKSPSAHLAGIIQDSELEPGPLYQTEFMKHHFRLCPLGLHFLPTISPLPPFFLSCSCCSLSLAPLLPNTLSIW